MIRAAGIGRHGFDIRLSNIKKEQCLFLLEGLLRESGLAWRQNGLYTLFHDCSVPGVQVMKLIWV